MQLLEHSHRFIQPVIRVFEYQYFGLCVANAYRQKNYNHVHSLFVTRQVLFNFDIVYYRFLKGPL